MEAGELLEALRAVFQATYDRAVAAEKRVRELEAENGALLDELYEAKRTKDEEAA